MPTLSPTLVDQTLLEMRGRVLALAADFDRLQRGGGAPTKLANDPRMIALREALNIVLESSTDRAQQVQMIFSDKTPLG
jgi:hypothetical protein